jgi:hypothetical protein
MPRKIVTVPERIDQIIASYAELNREAHELLDLATHELRAECPGVPFGVLKQCKFNNRAGTTLNIPKALEILREKIAMEKDPSTADIATKGDARDGSDFL